MTFPRNVGQVPIYYSMKSTGRPHIPFRKYRTGYIDCPQDPLYPFGYGLSYSTVDYSDAEASYDAGDKTVKASVKVTNVSDRAVTETVQLYVRDVVASVTRPMKELKGFRQVELGPGESRTVSFDVPVSELGFWTPDLKYVVETGKFVVEIGPDSQRTLSSEIEYTDVVSCPAVPLK